MDPAQGYQWDDQACTAALRAFCVMDADLTPDLAVGPTSDP